MFSLKLTPDPQSVTRAIEEAVKRGVKAAQLELNNVKTSAQPSSSKAHSALRAALGKIDTGDREMEVATKRASEALQAAIS